jgi:hypothetical protein
VSSIVSYKQQADTALIPQTLSSARVMKVVRPLPPVTFYNQTGNVSSFYKEGKNISTLFLLMGQLR